MNIRLISPEEICELFGKCIKTERLRQIITQKTLAAMAGVSLPTVQRFESNGGGTFETFSALMIALRKTGDLEEVLVTPPIQSSFQKLCDHQVLKKFAAQRMCS